MILLNLYSFRFIMISVFQRVTVPGTIGTMPGTLGIVPNTSASTNLVRVPILATNARIRVQILIPTPYSCQLNEKLTKFNATIEDNKQNFKPFYLKKVSKAFRWFGLLRIITNI